MSHVLSFLSDLPGMYIHNLNCTLPTYSQFTVTLKLAVSLFLIPLFALHSYIPASVLFTLVIFSMFPEGNAGLLLSSFLQVMLGVGFPEALQKTNSVSLSFTLWSPGRISTWGGTLVNEGKRFHGEVIWNEFRRRGRRVLPEFWMGVCRTVIKTLTPFQTEIYDFPYPFSDLTPKWSGPLSRYLIQWLFVVVCSLSPFVLKINVPGKCQFNKINKWTCDVSYFPVKIILYYRLKRQNL